MFLKTFRKFSYKPLSPLEFIDKKALILDNSNMSRLSIYGNIGSIGIPALLSIRILKNYSSMGWFNFFFSSSILLIAISWTKTWFTILPYLVKRIYLCDDGKHIQTETYGFRKNQFKIKISEIINPEDNLESKLKINYYSTWIIDTTKGDTFYVLPDSISFHKDVLKEILKGQDVIIQEKVKDIKEDIIDI